jgi:hypothetical protein
MWYIFTMEYYSAIKNEIILFVGKQMELKIIMLREVSQTQDKTCMLSLILETRPKI